MKKIYFENEQGRVDMFLSGSGPVRVTALSGFGNPTKKYTTAVFAGKNGQRTLSSVANPRTLIIGGDVRVSEEGTLENMVRVLDEPGWLYLEFGNKRRKIFCEQVEFEDGARKGNYMNFMLTLTADSVYFIDFDCTDIEVFKQEDIILNEIIFPCMFSVKNTQATVENYGEVKVEPVFTIYNYHNEGSEITDKIVIDNKTTGQKIEIVTATKLNEKITVDIENRKIKSSVRGDITYLISDDTFLNDFWLVPGQNLIAAHHGNTGEEISVVCSYYSNYREGLY